MNLLEKRKAFEGPEYWSSNVGDKVICTIPQNEKDWFPQIAQNITKGKIYKIQDRSEEHTSELQSH